MMRFRTPLAFGLMFISIAAMNAYSLYATQQDDPDAGWEKVGDQDGLTLFKKEIPGSSLVAFKGEGIIDAPISKVFTVMVDYSRGSEWIDHLAEIRVVKWLSKNEFLTYSHVNTPFIIKDRDFLTYAKITVDPATKTLVFNTRSTADASMPETAYVRAQLNFGRYVLRPLEGGDKTFLAAEFHVDPRGSIPKWVVNLFQKGWPRESFRGIRKQVAKTDIQEPKDQNFKGIIGQVKVIEVAARTTGPSKGRATSSVDGPSLENK